MVTAPFNNTVAPVSSWARFALANGFNRTSSAVYGSCESACSAVLAAVSNRLSSFAISPACGVITTWPGTRSGSRSSAPASTTIGGMS